MSTVPRRRLTRRRILRAALALIDRDGLDALTMRKLGAALGVEAMALYRHVPSKDALLDGVVELLAQEIDVPPPGSEWRDALRRILRSYRTVAHAHPHAFPLIALRPLQTADARARADAVVQMLLAAGFDERTAAVAFGTAASYANGFLLEELTVARPNGAGEYEAGADVILTGLELELDRVGRRSTTSRRGRRR